MSLTFQGEHLAWQQRIGQEQSRSNNFNETQSPKHSVRKNPFPGVNQSDVDSNYMSQQFNLGYAFGGKRPIKDARLSEPPTARKDNLETVQNEYIKYLEEKLRGEKAKRRKAERKYKK